MSCDTPALRRVDIAPPETLPVSLAEAKAWMRLSLSEDDALIAALIRTACDLCEAFTGLLLIARKVVETQPMRTGQWQRLAHGPVAAITAVEGLPAEGAPFALPVAHYAIDIDALGDGFVRVVQPGAAGRLRVTYQAGLGADGNAVPESVRQGLLRLVAHLYAARDDARDVAPPAAVAALWHPFRRMTL